MMSLTRNFSGLVVASLFLTSAVLAASANAAGSVGTEAQTRAQLDASLAARQEALVKKAAKVSAKARARAETQLEASASRVDQCVAKDGEAVVAGRLAGELGIDADALMAEQNELGCDWGDLMIAHGLQSNAKTDLEATQLVQLHQAGCQWADVAAGLGIELNSAVGGLASEAKVASGLAHGDGRMSVMTGAGTRAGLGLGTGVKVGGTSAGVGAAAGVGVKIGK